MKQKLVFLFGVFLLSLTHVSAQVVELSRLKDEVFVDTSKYFIDVENKLKPEQISILFHQNKFKNTGLFDEILGVGKHNFWISFEVNNESPVSKELVFEVAIARLNRFSLYSEQNNQINYEGTCGGIGTPIEAKPLKSYSHALKVNLRANSKQRFYFLINKFPGSVRNAVVLHNPTHFEQKQRDSNSRLSFYLALVIIVFISSIVIWIHTRRNSYFIFTILIVTKTLLNLQFGEYNHLLQGLGFANLSTSILILLIITLQYQFFKIYINQKVATWIYVLIGIAITVDFIWGASLQPLRQYHILQYVIVFILSLIFIYELLKKFPQFKAFDIPFLTIQLMPFLILVIVLLSYQFNFANNFFRKYDYELLFYFSLIELLVYFFYLFYGVISLNKSNQIKTEALNHLQGKIIHIQESERRKIAHDLHDDLGSTLSVLKEKIFGVTDNSETQDLINKAIDDLRNISHNLLPADFETFGFIPALEKYIHKLNGIGLKITFIIFGERQILPSSSELNLYRILVEILHNIKKHSQSKEATVQLIYHDTFLYISVETNDQIKKTEEKGNGIGEKSIISRLEYLQARVLEKGDGKNGYSYIFEIPYDQNPNS
jgi:signal transduction histidine kinase